MDHCENEFCDNESVECVPVSVAWAGDETRNLCGCCRDAYIIGVQHGRLSENPDAYGHRVVEDADELDAAGALAAARD